MYIRKQISVFTEGKQYDGWKEYPEFYYHHHDHNHPTYICFSTSTSRPSPLAWLTFRVDTPRKQIELPKKEEEDSRQGTLNFNFKVARLPRRINSHFSVNREEEEIFRPPKPFLCLRSPLPKKTKPSQIFLLFLYPRKKLGPWYSQYLRWWRKEKGKKQKKEGKDGKKGIEPSFPPAKPAVPVVIWVGFGSLVKPVKIERRSAVS